MHRLRPLRRPSPLPPVNVSDDTMRRAPTEYVWFQHNWKLLPMLIYFQVSRAETMVIDSLGEVPAALRLIQAIRQASALGAIRYSPSKVDGLAECMMDGGSGDLSLDDVDREDDYVYAKLTDEDKDRENRNNVCNRAS